MQETRFQVHKFGGTSVKDAERYCAVAAIVASARRRPFVVVSAMAGVTDALISILGLARGKDGSYREEFSRLLARHRDTARALFADGPDLAAMLDVIERDADDLSGILRSTFLMRGYSEATLEYGARRDEVVLTLSMGVRASRLDDLRSELVHAEVGPDDR
jgi:aspartokinase